MIIPPLPPYVGALEELSNDSGDPSQRTLLRGKGRVDAVAMLIERREWGERAAAQRNGDADPLQSLHLFADGSPVVGTEIQGMLIEQVYMTGQVIMDILPGICLAHGCYGWMEKAFALLWVAYPFASML